MGVMRVGARRLLPTTVGLSVLLIAQPALAHEGQVIQFGSFLGGLTHPVLGLDHFLAMVSVGIVSAFIGGKAIWTVPATFVVSMALGTRGLRLMRRGDRQPASGRRRRRPQTGRQGASKGVTLRLD